METKVNDSAFLPIGILLSLQYKIIGHIGAGGFGKTYLIEDQLGNKKVMKEFFISSMCTRDSSTNSVTVSVDENRGTFKEQLEAFKREARRINGLSHPNIVKVSGLFEANDTAYYVMDYIEGETLANKISKEKLTETQINRYLNQLLDALEYIHSQELTHLDIKPGNIMIDKNDNVVLIDFGASKLFNAQSVNKTMMTSKRPPFTLGYAPAEQENGNLKDMGPHCDIYALGATLYTLYMGKKPDTPFDLLQNGLSEIPNASPKMQDVIKKSMAYMVKDRIKTVAEFREALVGVIPEDISDEKTELEQNDVERVTQKKEINKQKQISWIGITQFLVENKLLDMSTKLIKYLRRILLFGVVFMVLLFTATLYLILENKIYDGTIQKVLAFVVSRFEILHTYYPGDCDYSLCYIDAAACGAWLIIFFLTIISLVLLSKLKSKVLSEIDAIEEISSYAGGRVLRIRNSAKKIGLCKCWKLFVKKILPIEYDAIYPCDVNVFICEQKGKKGVYNVELKKMMIPVEHDEIHITSDNKLEVYKNGVVTKYTTKGFRLIS